jgi:hypothetical protein
MRRRMRTGRINRDSLGEVNLERARYAEFRARSSGG